MKKRILLVAFCSIAFVFNAYAAMPQKGDKVFVRSNLRAEGYIIAWHNLSLSPDIIPAGTEVNIISCRGQEIVFTKGTSDKKYKIVANASQWDKYLVNEIKEINLDNYSPDQLAKKEIATGMTKEEVYLLKGCPAYIGYGVKSNDHTLSDIIKSDTWYYMQTSRRHDDLVKFEKGVVVSIGKY